MKRFRIGCRAVELASVAADLVVPVVGERLVEAGVGDAGQRVAIAVVAAVKS